MSTTKVTPMRHKNVEGKESQYIKIETEKGSIVIKSGESTLTKLAEIGIKENDNDTKNKKGVNEMAINK